MNQKKPYRVRYEPHSKGRSRNVFESGGAGERIVEIIKIGGLRWIE